MCRKANGVSEKLTFKVLITTAADYILIFMPLPFSIGWVGRAGGAVHTSIHPYIRKMVSVRYLL